LSSDNQRLLDALSN